MSRSIVACANGVCASDVMSRNVKTASLTLLIKGCDRPKSSLLHSCIFPVAKYVNVVNVEITSISARCRRC